MGEKKADKVSLGLSLNYETGSVPWTWSDSQKQGVSHQYVTLDRGKTEVNIRQELIGQYGYWERQRIKQYTKISLWHVAAEPSSDGSMMALDV
ncbi:hypothetical protein FVER53590_25784 [Fusarium verticillioides]|nr:hypothetical protein FVER53590_25784 [Fusarium verticillioides]